MAAFDITPLRSAVSRLREGFERMEREPEDEAVRDSVIKRFEFTYELVPKTLKRFYEVSSSNALEPDHMTFPQVIRTANEQGLLREDWERWKQFRDARNKTAHAYSEPIAREVLAEVPDLMREAEFLVGQLAERGKHLDV